MHEKQVEDSQRDREHDGLLKEVADKAMAAVLNSGYSLSQIDASRSHVEVSQFRLSWSATELPQQWYFRIHYEAVVTGEKFLGLIGWRPGGADTITLEIPNGFDVSRALECARRNDMSIDLILDDRIRISSEKWPSFTARSYWSRLALDVARAEAGTEITATYVPYDISRLGCVRHFIRLVRWLGTSRLGAQMNALPIGKPAGVAKHLYYHIIRVILFERFPFVPLQPQAVLRHILKPDLFPNSGRLTSKPGSYGRLPAGGRDLRPARWYFVATNR